ncbi:phosphoadenosine phosphosulfate reductase family protein [Bacillus cereus]|uniref:phosphoadenosine phosphosulfate reductase domain-containing protein n=1 Tax=Bacillus cereus group TaxID=86661 RepID=UPI001BADF9F4|nr:phosphoadenosine phosphosulfate reductase family protein [Bacillus cereus]MBR9655790.1 phosphoadenosine phosphosulfate reductase [Bacillus cereus]
MKTIEISAALELGITDALFRIHRDYLRTGGLIYLSFSGGKDSTVVAELIKIANLPIKIPFVFANTGIELNATLEHVKNYDYENVVLVKPRKPAVKIWKEDGRPIKSKLKSEALGTYQRHIDKPLSTSRTRQLISGEAEKAGEKTGKKTMYSLAKKDFHLLHPDLEYKIANKCCHYMKKLPFKDFAKDNDMYGTFTGVRSSEGGVRAATYKSCVHIGKGFDGREYITSMPIFDWTDEMMNEFIEVFDVKLSDAYTIYGMERTGCMACPFSKDIQFDLETIFKYEPIKYKASMKMLKHIYMDSGVECPWDEEYMQEYEERKKLNEQRREEMLERYVDQLTNMRNLK